MLIVKAKLKQLVIIAIITVSILIAMPILTLAQSSPTDEVTIDTVTFRENLLIGRVPEASTRGILNPQLFSNCPNQCQSLDNVTQKLNQALTNSGYSQQGWHIVKSRLPREVSLEAYRNQIIQSPFVAVITEVEQIQQNGYPRTDGKRWTLEFTSPQIGSFRDLITTILKGAPPGKYRSFLFVLSHSVKAVTNLSPPAERELNSWRNLLRSGGRVPLLNDLSSISSKDFLCYYFVYEYEISPIDGSIVFVKNSQLKPEEHLKRSGIWQSLGI